MMRSFLAAGLMFVCVWRSGDQTRPRTLLPRALRLLQKCRCFKK